MIITITNNRGGSGKSTTAQTLARGLVLAKKRVLLIDLDPQLNTTDTIDLKDATNDIYKVLTNQCTIQDAIYTSKFNYDFIKGSKGLASIDYIIASDINLQFKKHKLLKEQLYKIKNNYDFIIIDTSPSVSTLTTNAIYSSDYVIIPMLADIYSIQGLSTITEQIKAIKEQTDNKNIKILGLLLTHYKAQTNINQGIRESINNIANMLGTKVYNSTIRDSVIFSESQFNKSTCIDMYPTHNATIDYINFIKEFLRDMEDNKNE